MFASPPAPIDRLLRLLMRLPLLLAFLLAVRFGHVARAKRTMENTILQGKAEKKISRGRPARQWLNDIYEWTGMRSNEMCREPDDSVAWRMRVSRVTRTDLDSQ